MNRITLITFFVLMNLGTGLAQDRCHKNLEIAQKYLEKRTNMRQALRNEIQQSVDTCQLNNGRYYYVQGLLDLRTTPNPNYKEAFNHFKEAAQYDFTRAKTYLGYFYKNGWSIPIDYNQSLYWIRQAAEEGDNNALYTLGYYYLKGLADLEPDYEKAVSYFEQSNHQMAKHWLAFCTYFGFGTDKDTYDAENLLENTDAPNSSELLAFLENAQYGTALDFDEFTAAESVVSANFFNTSENQLLYGTWLEKDWKNEQVVRKLPVILTTGSHNNNESNFKLKINDIEYPFVIDNSGHLLSQDLSIELPSAFSEDVLHFTVDDIVLHKDIQTGIYDIEFTTWVDEYGEDGAPITIRIYSQEALARKIDKTLRFFPNAFTNTLNVSFDIEHQSSVTLSLYDLSGNIVKTKEYGVLEPGLNQLEFLAEDIIPQNLIAVLSVNSVKLARQVIKLN